MDTRRLILVLIFTFSSFMLWESWQKYNQPKPPATAGAALPADNAVPQPTAALQAAPAPGTPAAAQVPVVPAGETFTRSDRPGEGHHFCSGRRHRRA